MLSLQQWWAESRQVGVIPCSEFQQLLKKKEFAGETAREIDCAVRELTSRAYQTAVDILTRYRQQIDDGAQQLLEKETLLAVELPPLPK